MFQSIRHTAFILLFSGTLALATVAEGKDTPSSAPPAVWTAEKAVSFALAKSPDSHIILEKIREAEAAARITEATDYPSLGLSSTYGQTNNPMYSFGNILNQGAFNDSIDFNAPGRTDNLQVKAEVQYRLYNGGQDTANQDAATARLLGSRIDRTVLHRQLAFEVVRAFHAIIQAQEMTAVRKASLEAITASLDVAKARYDAGTLLQEDLLNLELQQASATEILIQNKHAEELAKRRFLNLLGLPAGEVVLDGRSSNDQELPQQITSAGRQELQSLKTAIAAAEAELRAAKAARRPTLDSFASYQMDSGSVLNAEGDSWMAGLRMNYSLFDGGKTTSAIALAEARVRETKALEAKTILALDLEIQQAELEYSQAKQRLQVTEKMVTVAEETARLSRERFKEGVILAIDLIDVETRLTDALARRSSAKTMHLIARANLRRAMGLPQFAEVETEREMNQ
jgi:outer membrane protein TolC